LSHQLEDTRAGFINPDFDQFVLSERVANPEAISAHSVPISNTASGLTMLQSD
jgi:hypothetical protein